MGHGYSVSVPGIQDPVFLQGMGRAQKKRAGRMKYLFAAISHFVKLNTKLLLCLPGRYLIVDAAKRDLLKAI
jgi:hypothetical protein